MEPQYFPEASLAANVSGVAARAGFLKGISTSRVAATPACTPAAGVSSRALAPIVAAPTTRHLSGSPMGPGADFLSLKIIVPAFYVGAGIAFFMGVVAAVLGSIGRRIPLYLAFSLMCFPAAGFIYFSGYYHGSASLAEAAWALRWQSACGFLAVPPFFSVHRAVRWPGALWKVAGSGHGAVPCFGDHQPGIALQLALHRCHGGRTLVAAVGRADLPGQQHAPHRGADPVPRCDFFRVVLGAVAMCRGVPIP